jgi:hypothetical protein
VNLKKRHSKDKIMPEGVFIGIMVGLMLVGLCRPLARCCRFYRDMVILGEATKLYGTGPRGSGEREKKEMM